MSRRKREEKRKEEKEGRKDNPRTELPHPNFVLSYFKNCPISVLGPS